jgi:hypothetical protein
MGGLPDHPFVGPSPCSSRPPRRFDHCCCPNRGRLLRAFIRIPFCCHVKNNWREYTSRETGRRRVLVGHGVGKRTRIGRKWTSELFGVESGIYYCCTYHGIKSLSRMLKKQSHDFARCFWILEPTRCVVVARGP